MQKYKRFTTCVALVVAFDKRFVAKNITYNIAISYTFRTVSNLYPYVPAPTCMLKPLIPQKSDVLGYRLLAILKSDALGRVGHFPDGHPTYVV